MPIDPRSAASRCDSDPRCEVTKPSAACEFCGGPQPTTLCNCNPTAAQPHEIPAGPGGPGGWDCHTFEDGETFPAICLADDCPDRDKRNPRRFDGEVLLSVELD